MNCHQTIVKLLVDASIAAQARLFRFERDRQLELSSSNEERPSVFLTKELSDLQAALVAVFGDYSTVSRLIASEVAVQDARKGGES